MDIGVLIAYTAQTDAVREFEKIQELGLQSCQVCIWDPALYTDDNAEALKCAARRTGVRISTLWAGWSGPKVWDFYEGPTTLGLVPSAYRAVRLAELQAASDFAEKLEVVNIATHVGFLPENPNHSDFIEVVTALRYLAGYMKDKGQFFLFETGQETPTTLVRAIEEIGTGNLGINFDTANLIMYGKAASTNAAHILGRYIRDVHCKDGLFPTDGRSLGEEVPLGRGCANMPEVLQILLACGYEGPLTIEREITGEDQIRDIIAARDLLKRMLAAV